MDKLVKLISSKTGLDEKMARQVVDIVAGYLKDTLPPPLNQNVDKLLSGQVSSLSQIPGLGGQGFMSKLLRRK